MRIATRCSEEIKRLWLEKKLTAGNECIFADSQEDLFSIEADVYIDLLYADDSSPVVMLNKPLFIHAVITTLTELPVNCIRINGWNGFMQNETIEIAAAEKNMEIVAAFMKELNYSYKRVPDVPGMIAPRIISMIINEAYYALEDKVSTKEEIDIAMRLGTNYPMGPFEWSKKIGLKNIYTLLKKLHSTDSRYAIAPLLQYESNNIIN